MTDMGHPGTPPDDTGPVADFGSASGQADTIGDWAASLTQLLETAFREIDTDRERAKASIAKASVLVRAQIERLASEVNQPLAAIAANATASLRWLTRENPEVGEATSAIREVLGEVERASRMMQRIRALARTNEPQMTKLDINSVIDDVMTLIEQEARSRRVSVQLDREPRLPSVHGDMIQIRQVIINLIVNGIQAMASLTGRSRKLVIRTCGYDSHSVLVAVEDAGVGTDAEDLDQLFSAFYSTKSNGMGMGLAISRSIVEAHRGRIWAIRNSGPGMTFQFTLPIHGVEP